MVEMIFWAGLAAALWFSWVLFRDLGDVPQLLIPIPRDRAIHSWYRRHRVALLAALGLAASVLGFGFYGSGNGLALGVLGGISGFLWFCDPACWRCVFTALQRRKTLHRAYWQSPPIPGGCSSPGLPGNG